MAWIETIEPEKSDKKLEKIYNKISDERGKVSNVFKIHSLLPKTMDSHLQLYKSIVFNKNGIDRKLVEMIAVTVSIENKCDYCVNHHKQALAKYLDDKETLDAFLRNPLSILNKENRAVLDYAVKLTNSPEKVNDKDIELLKSFGFSDEDILNIVLVISYFNFVNRNVLALGVEYSENEIKGYNY